MRRPRTGIALLALSLLSVFPGTAETGGVDLGIDAPDEDEFFEGLEEEATDYENLCDSVLMEAEDFDGLKEDKAPWKIIDGVDGSRKWIQQIGAGTISRRFRARTPGRYFVWIRYLLHPDEPCPFTVTIRQKAEEALRADYHNFAAAKGTPSRRAEEQYHLYFDDAATHDGMVMADVPVWEAKPAELVAGEGTLTISIRSPWLKGFTQKIDCVLLTRSESYRPVFSTFQDIYVRMRPVALRPANTEARMDIGIYWGAVRIIKGRNTQGSGVSSILAPDGKMIREGGWSDWVNLREHIEPGSWENTVRFALTGDRPITYLKGEMEVAWGKLPGQVIRGFVEENDGHCVTIMIPNSSVRTRDQVREGIRTAGWIKWLNSVSDVARRHLETVQAMEFRGNKLPKKYPFFTAVSGGHSTKAHETELRCVSRLGINAPFLLNAWNLKIARNLGMMDTFVPRVVGGTAGYPPRKACPNDPGVPARVRKTTAHYPGYYREIQPDGPECVWMMKNGDEIGWTVGPTHAQRCSNCIRLFREYLERQGMSPRLFGVERWEEVGPAWDPQAVGRTARRLHYHTALFLSYNTALLYKQMVDAHTATMPNRPYVYSNYAPSPLWSGMGLDWFIMGREGAFSIAWSEDWLWGRDRWELVSFAVDVLRNIAEENGIPFGMYIVARTGGFMRKSMSLLGRGAAAEIVYNWGPRYAFADQFSEFPAVQQEVGDTTRLVGECEDYLYGSKPVPAEVALLYSRSEEIWPADESGIKNRHHVYFALLHDQVPVDLITEDQVAAGKLSRYKILYVTSAHLQRKAAEQIREWVKAGGFLWADGEAATRDEYDEPLGLLDRVLGRKYLYTERHRQLRGGLGYGNIGDPIDACTLGLPGQDERREVEVYLLRAMVEPEEGTTVTGTYKDGRPAALLTRTDRGQALYFTFPVGISYRRRLGQKDFDPSQDYRERERRPISHFPLHAGVVRPVELSTPVIEAIMTEGKGGRTVVLINFRFKPVDSLTVRILERGQPIRKVRSARHGLLEMTRSGGRAIVSLPLDQADVLMID